MQIHTDPKITPLCLLMLNKMKKRSKLIQHLVWVLWPVVFGPSLYRPSVLFVWCHEQRGAQQSWSEQAADPGLTWQKLLMLNTRIKVSLEKKIQKKPKNLHHHQIKPILAVDYNYRAGQQNREQPERGPRHDTDKYFAQNKTRARSRKKDGAVPAVSFFGVGAAFFFSFTVYNVSKLLKHSYAFTHI